MKKILFIFLTYLILISCGNDEETSLDNNSNNIISEKAIVVGYLPTWRFSLNNSIEYCKITHLNLAFANPDADGNLIIPRPFNSWRKMPNSFRGVSNKKEMDWNSTLCFF